jgi:hypothetical protein
MNTTRFRTCKIFLTAGFLAVPACGDSSAPAGESLGVEFAYAGTLSGSFRAVGPATGSRDPHRSFAVAFRGAAGELQLCAYQAMAEGRGSFLLLNAGPAARPGDYAVPPKVAAGATSHQPGTFLVGVDSSRTAVEQISPFVQGQVQVEQLSTTHVRGSFTVTSLLTQLKDGRFDVPMTTLAELPVICQ